MDLTIYCIYCRIYNYHIVKNIQRSAITLTTVTVKVKNNVTNRTQSICYQHSTVTRHHRTQVDFYFILFILFLCANKVPKPHVGTRRQN